MGRAINNENAIDRLEIDVTRLKGEMKELQDVVEELSRSLVSTKQVHHVDMDEISMDEIRESCGEPPVGKRKKTTKVEKSNAEA